MEQRTIAKWETFTKWFSGSDREDAYQSVEFTAEFTCRNRRMWVRGFYDGDGRYGLRMMPDSEGTWRYETTSNVPELNGRPAPSNAAPPPLTARWWWKKPATWPGWPTPTARTIPAWAPPAIAGPIRGRRWKIRPWKP